LQGENQQELFYHDPEKKSDEMRREKKKELFESVFELTT